MKTLFFQLFIIILVIGCNSKSKTMKIEEKEVKTILVESNKEKAYVKQNFNSNIEIEAFPKSKKNVFEQFGFPDKISGEKWEYYNVNGFTSIEYSFLSCCDEISSLIIKNAVTNLRSSMFITHVKCKNGLSDTIKREKFKLQK